MWSTNKKDRCLRLSLLILNFAACVGTVFIYLRCLGEQDKVNIRISPDDHIQSEKLTDEQCIPVCDSRACVWHANLLLKNMNETADPCNNIRSFLCGKFVHNFGPDEVGSTIAETKIQLISRLKGILDNLEPESGSASGKMKIVYDSCVNYGSSELQGIADLKEFFNNLGLLNWPSLAHNFSFSDMSLPTILGHFVLFGGYNFITLERAENNEESQVAVFQVSTSFMDLDISRDLAVSIQKYFDLEIEDIESITKDYERVKSSLSNLYEESTNVTCEVNCSAIRINCSSQHDADWGSLCETIEIFLNLMNMKDEIKTYTIKIYKDDEEFFKNLFLRLRFLSDRSVANFLALNFFDKHYEELNFYFRLSKLKHRLFSNEVERVYFEIDRWRYCVLWIANNMKLPLGNEFVRQYVTNTVMEEFIDIYNEYMHDIIGMVAFQEWMPPDLKMRVLDKIRNNRFSVLELSQLLPNDTHVDDFFKMFNPTRESFFKNVLELKRTWFTTNSPIKPLNMEYYSRYRTKFEVQAITLKSIIEVDYGMFLPPFYGPGHNKLLNRVLLAPILGHEFGHLVYFKIFDDIRSKLYSWSQEVFKEYLVKAYCVIDQFSRFKYDYLNENLNGTYYVTETLPDTVAAAILDKIIDKYSSSQDIILPALPYSTKQLLYMSANQMWCSKSNLETVLLYYSKEGHPPSEARISGIMQNSKGYPEAFLCPEGSFMNPVTKCALLDTNRTINVEETQKLF